MAGLLTNLLRVMKSKSRRKLKEKVKNIVEKDRILQKRLARAS